MSDVWNDRLQSQLMIDPVEWMNPVPAENLNQSRVNSIMKFDLPLTQLEIWNNIYYNI